MLQWEKVLALFNLDKLKEENAFHQQLVDRLKYTGLYLIIAMDSDANKCAIGLKEILLCKL